MGPVSDTGRAMMASLQQAMAKGMPIDQAIAYVKGMAQQGVAPMVDLYAMLNQFQRLKQPQAQMPQGGTIKDQIAAASAQRDQQEMMQRGIASMPPQRAPQEPMAQGLGGMSAPAMEQAQFAGGGIVAFAGGGTPQGALDYTDQNAVLANLQGQFGGDPSDYLTREAGAQESAYERMGLGAARKAREEDVAQQQAEAEQYAGSAGQTNLAQYFFELAANASKPGARFLSAAAQAAPGYGQRKTAIDEKTRLLSRAAKEGKLKLMEADELRKAGYLKDAEAKREEGIKQMIQVGSNIAKERGEMTRAQLSAKTQKEVAGMYVTPRGAAADIAALTHIIATEKGDTEESRARIDDATRRLQVIDPKQAATQARILSAENANRLRELQNQRNNLTKQTTSPSFVMLPTDQQKAIMTRLDNLNRQISEINEGTPEASTPAQPMNAQGAIPPPPPGFKLNR